jgi:mono/diheme cytochrome c family protein
MKRALLIVLLVAAVVAATAQKEYVPDPSWRPPAKDAAKKNPLKPSENVVAGGRKLFQKNCIECHGEQGVGVSHNAANLTSPAVRQESDGTLFWKITNGHLEKGMPSFSGLPELQRWQLVLYIRQLQRDHDR